MSAVDFWSRHLAACQAQGVSINAYAKSEGLSAVSLYYWRKRLGLAGSRPRDVVASPFVPIQVERSGDCAGSCQLILGDGPPAVQTGRGTCLSAQVLAPIDPLCRTR
jgi:transposase-like protein